jgi:hypothetical protein
MLERREPTMEILIEPIQSEQPTGGEEKTDVQSRNRAFRAPDQDPQDTTPAEMDMIWEGGAVYCDFE